MPEWNTSGHNIIIYYYNIMYYNKHGRQCFIGISKPKKGVENTMNSRVFLTKFEVFG